MKKNNQPQTFSERFSTQAKVKRELKIALLWGVVRFGLTPEEIFKIVRQEMTTASLHDDDLDLDLQTDSTGVVMLNEVVAAHNSGVSAPAVPEGESGVVLTRGVKDWVSMLADDAGVDVDLDDLDAAQAANLLRKYDDYKVSLEEEMTANKEFLEDLVELLSDNEGGATASITKH